MTALLQKQEICSNAFFDANMRKTTRESKHKLACQQMSL